MLRDWWADWSEDVLAAAAVLLLLALGVVAIAMTGPVQP